MRRRASTLLELLVTVIVVGVVMVGFLPAFSNALRMQMTSVGTPGAQCDAKNIVLKIADAARGATLCTATDVGCTVDAVAENASATAITLYRRNDDGTLTKRAFAVSGGAFTAQVGSAAADTFATGATISLKYYGASSYNPSALTAFMPTNSTLKTLAAIEIAASVNLNGSTESYTTTIRLRNSPKLP